MQLIVPCTSKKRYEAAYQLRDVEPGTTEERLSTWHEMLFCRPWLNGCPRHHPIDRIYCGPSWSMVRKIRRTIERRTGAEVGLHVASAGYGLVGEPPGKPRGFGVRPYSATFAAGLPDSVGTAAECREWWNGVSMNQRGLHATWGWGSVSMLADVERERPMLCVLSPSYFSALVDDLVAAVEHRDPSELMIVTSAAAPVHPDLEPHVVRADATMRGALSTNNVLLNHAAALSLVKHLDLSGGFDVDHARFLLRSLRGEQRSLFSVAA